MAAAVRGRPHVKWQRRPGRKPSSTGGALVVGHTGCGRKRSAKGSWSLARSARGVRKFGLEGVPQSSAVPLALGRALAGRRKLAEAQIELERAVSTRRRFSSLNFGMTLVGLLALAPVRAARGDGARALLAKAQAIIETYPEAGMFPELLERWQPPAA
jgi:hypothetical protein